MHHSQLVHMCDVQPLVAACHCSSSSSLAASVVAVIAIRSVANTCPSQTAVVSKCDVLAEVGRSRRTGDDVTDATKCRRTFSEIVLRRRGAPVLSAAAPVGGSIA